MLGPVLLLAALPQTSTVSLPGHPTLSAVLKADAFLLDYELPGHPNTLGKSHLGAVVDALIRYRLEHIMIDAGARARVPFTLDFEEEVGGLPIVSFTVRPFDENIILRLGSLDMRHGYHPAIVDEARYRYGRPVEENYNLSLPPEAQRDFAKDPFMPGEHGLQLIGDLQWLRAEAFLDWQLLDTDEHREKFAFGMLGEFRDPFVDLGAQFRIVHYGGQLFTASDELRMSGIDRVRQPFSIALFAKPRPIVSKTVTLELLGAFLLGKMIQAPWEEETVRTGFEAGARAVFLEELQIGYSYFAPRGNRAGYFGEDGDPVYNGQRSHRFRVGLQNEWDGLSLRGRIDIIAPVDVSEVQYEAVTELSYDLELPLLD